MDVTIAPKFPKLTRGNDCEGREITGPNGERLGCLYREIEWIDTGFTTVSYGRHKVTGYRFERYAADAVDQTFAELGEATKAIRAFFKGL